MYPCMKLKHLESNLQDIETFSRPKIHLEQYSTPIHLASSMLHTIQSNYNDIENCIVGDFGCGSGTLSIGSALLDAALVIGFEIDPEAIEIFKNNLDNYELDNIDIVNLDILKNNYGLKEKYFDTIIMNPPFGTKNNEGIDMLFLSTAFRLAKNVVYSLHKTSTRDYIVKFCKENQVKAKVLAEMNYNLPATYKFHKKTSVDIKVDFYQFKLS